jgi:uncharacterized secreted protein with C-terminal beta-propeller domain
MVHTWSCRFNRWWRRHGTYLKLCTMSTSSSVETTTSGMYNIYVIVCWNDNFRYVPCLRHHLLKRQLQVCTMSTSSSVETTTSPEVVVSTYDDVDMVHTWSCCFNRWWRRHGTYLKLSLNDNFRYVPCLLHHMLKRQLQVCTMSTSSSVETTTSGMYHAYVIICMMT